MVAATTLLRQVKVFWEAEEQHELEDSEELFSHNVEVARVSVVLKAEVEDAKSLMPIAKCNAQEWCTLCHWWTSCQITVSWCWTFELH